MVRNNTNENKLNYNQFYKYTQNIWIMSFHIKKIIFVFLYISMKYFLYLYN